MSKLSFVAVVAMLALVAVGPAAAKTVNISWTLQMPKHTFTACQGDTVVFKWGGVHDVNLVNNLKSTSAICTTPTRKELAGISSKQFVWKTSAATKAGTYPFMCSVGSHCKLGQYAFVTIAKC